MIRSVMQMELVRNLKVRTILFFRYGWRKKGLWLRALLCWLISFGFIIADQEHDYDVRLQLRGPQIVDNKIVIVLISNQERTEWLKSQPSAWEQLLSIILPQKPLVVGVTQFLNEEISNQNPSQVLSNKKVIWAARLTDKGKILKTEFAKTHRQTVATNDYPLDHDGIIRRFHQNTAQAPHMAQAITAFINPEMKNKNILTEQLPIINFRGPSGTFPQIHLHDVVAKMYPKDYFKNKVVLIGTPDSEGTNYRTPMGVMPKAELLANTIENIHNKQFIRRLQPVLSAILLILFVLLTAWITSNYPQFLAFFLISVINIFFATFSIWIFDTQFFWIPIMAPIIASFATYITFLSFQLTLKEYLNTQLENEKQFLFDVEQLKNNFLSLISHDLKTPIAKIQAICDRLIAQHSDQGLTTDLTSLREIASELHRYIQTILQITRVESHNFRINKDAADINEIIESVIQKLQPLAFHKKIQLKFELEPMFLIEIDHVLIHEVILNLVENAIKYSPEGSLVKVTSQEVDDQVLLVVEDQGPGIPTQEQARIFEKFYQGELGKLQPKGSGLGLYLVKYFVELHAGKIFLDSKPGETTRIGFTLPIGDAIEQERLENISAPKGVYENPS
ncbi:MAG: ATP-binding protein [Bdellovibrionales bacterium]